MFEYHGWASLRSSTLDAEPPQLQLEGVRRRMRELDGSGEFGLRFINGSLHVWLTGNPNHRHESVAEFFGTLAVDFPGSYGLLYVWDDESDYENAFRVFRLARGTVEELDDPFLSPCVPTIEDAYDPNRDR